LFHAKRQGFRNQQSDICLRGALIRLKLREPALTPVLGTRIGAISLGHAIQFVANASVLGYDVRGAIVLYGERGTPSLRISDCEHLWAQYGGALLQP
jgi:hypothetical protein